MPRHQQQERVRPAGQQFLVGGKHLLLFTRVRTAGNPRRPIASKCRAQPLSPIGHLGAQLQVELDIADHAGPRTLSPDGDEALSVLGGLRGDERTGGEDSPKQTTEAPVACHRLRRQPRAGKYQRYTAPFALRE